MANDNEPLVLTPKEVGKLLSLSRGVLYSALHRGAIPCIRVSPRKIIIPRDRFLRWLNEGGGNNLHPPE